MHYHYQCIILRKNLGGIFIRNLGDFLYSPFNFYLPKPTYVIIFISISEYLVSR